jgi:ribonuclease BN (tRNA processing enzyme)
MESGAKELVLYHHDPDHNDAIIDKSVMEARNYFPKVRAAAEGLEMHLGERTVRSAAQARK